LINIGWPTKVLRKIFRLLKLAQDIEKKANKSHSATGEIRCVQKVKTTDTYSDKYLPLSFYFSGHPWGLFPVANRPSSGDRLRLFLFQTGGSSKYFSIGGLEAGDMKVD